ncbi:MAG: FkbM family methyltransferase [Nitrososphaera sp.]|nr:FkbM family methyltransferase [Nitrososphaera sp.]
MIHFTKKIVRAALNNIGFDIVRHSKSSSYSLLGLRHLPIRSVIDVGANTGQFAKMISNIYPETHIYCFEPLPEPFKKLKEWADQQEGRVTVFNTALGCKEGNVDMLLHPDHTPSSSLLKTTAIGEALYPFTKKQATVAVELATLDKTIAKLPTVLNPDILIKLDVQGYEDRVIKGGVGTFCKARACIAEVCLDPLYEDQATFKEILVLLDEFGYRYVGNLDQKYADDGHVIFFDAVFLRELSA